MNGGSPIHYVNERYEKGRDDDPQRIKATLINYKYDSDDEKYFKNETKNFGEMDAWSLPQQNGSRNTLLTNGRNNNGSPRNPKWRKPRSNNGGRWVDGKNVCNKPISEVIAWGPASSDDDYNRKIGRGERSFIEADMYGKASLIGNGDIVKHPLDGDMIIPSAPPPPEYPGILIYQREI